MEIADPDPQGYSEFISMDYLVKINPNFECGNGGSWCRSDGSLGKLFEIVKKYDKGKISEIKLDGYKKQKTDRGIDESIRNEIIKRRCAVLDIGTNIECDHKNGKYNESKELTIDDFQPLNKTVNDSKRQHCKNCKESGIRYDAKRKGYSFSYTKGNEFSKNCEGCYWYDPIAFNKEISANFKKKK